MTIFSAQASGKTPKPPVLHQKGKGNIVENIFLWLVNKENGEIKGELLNFVIYFPSSYYCLLRFFNFRCYISMEENIKKNNGESWEMVSLSLLFSFLNSMDKHRDDLQEPQICYGFMNQRTVSLRHFLVHGFRKGREKESKSRSKTCSLLFSLRLK